MFINETKTMAHISQEGHTDQLDCVTDWQMAAREDIVISITLL